MDRTTISLPDGLVARLKPLGIPVSEICRIALEEKVVAYERIQEALQEEDGLERMVQRLKVSRDTAREEQAQWSFILGSHDGPKWVRDAADYVELVHLANPEVSIDDMPLPETAEEDVEEAKYEARTEREYFVYDSYRKGFLEAALEFWMEVKDRVSVEE